MIAGEADRTGSRSKEVRNTSLRTSAVLTVMPGCFLPECGCHSHVHKHRSSESLVGALRNHVGHTRDREVGHGLQPVHGDVEVLCEGADVV